MTGSPCGAGWRIESAALGSGAVQAVLPIVSFDAQTLLNGIGTGSFTMHPRDVKNLRYIWPHMTSLWVTYFDEFVWAGVINGLSIQNATVSMGCESIETYLKRRNIRSTLAYVDDDQNFIAASLVEYVRTNYGIPLRGDWTRSHYSRDRSYPATALLNVMDQLTALTGVINGPEWRVSAQRSGGLWEATMSFADHWGVDREVTLVSDTHAADYGLEVNTDNHSTLVDSTSGSPDDGSFLQGTAADPPYPAGTSPYVEFDTANTFDEVKIQNTLVEQSTGFLALNREPSITPRMVLSGREATQGLGLALGDTTDARICISGLQYEGPSRIIGDTWRAAPDTATVRELMLSPNNSPSTSMFDMKPCSNCPDCER